MPLARGTATAVVKMATMWRLLNQKIKPTGFVVSGQNAEQDMHFLLPESLTGKYKSLQSLLL